MILLVLGIAAGFIVGLFLPWQVPADTTIYVAVGILMCLDSLLGGTKSYLEKKFKAGLFFSFSGLAGNLVMGLLFTYVGEVLGIQLYLVPILVSGMRIFKNVSIIRNLLFVKFKKIS